jgi:SNF2 family DNA or RNA helicase
MPIHNRIGDLGSLLRFVRIPGLDSAETFKKHVTDVLKDSSRAERAKEVSDTLISVFVLRRTRAEVFTSGD